MAKHTDITRQKLLERSTLGISFGYFVACCLVSWAEPDRAYTLSVGVTLFIATLVWVKCSHRFHALKKWCEVFIFVFCLAVSAHLAFEFVNYESKKVLPYIIILFMFGASLSFTRVLPLALFLGIYVGQWTLISKYINLNTLNGFSTHIFLAGVYTFAVFGFQVANSKLKVLKKIDSSLAFFNNLVESFPQAFLFLDEHGRLTSIYGQQGLSQHFTVGKPIEEQFEAQTRASVQTLIQSVLEKRSLQETEVAVHDKIIHLRVLPVENNRVLVLALDVTEARQAERQAEADKNKLQSYAHLSEFGAFAGNVAHELNNPLGIVILNARMAKKAHQAGKTQAIEPAKVAVNDGLERIVELLATLEKAGVEKIHFRDEHITQPKVAS